MKLTNQDIDILQDLLEDKLRQIDDGQDSSETETYINIIKKLNTMYFN
jgi:uncharacterized protein YpiB (UPF0302 family)